MLFDVKNVFTYLVSSSGNEMTSHKDCSGIEYPCTGPVTTVATSSTPSLDGKRLNTSASHLKTRFYATDSSCQFYRFVAIALSCNKLAIFFYQGATGLLNQACFSL